MKKKKKKVKFRFFKEILIEVRDSILFEVLWWVLTLIPRLMIRLIKHLD